MRRHAACDKKYAMQAAAVLKMARHGELNWR